MLKRKPYASLMIKSRMLMAFTIGLLLQNSYGQAPLNLDGATVLDQPGGEPALAPIPYETPTPVPSRSVIPPKIPLSGKNYEIADTANPTGMLYSFTIRTPYGVYQPLSLRMLKVRIAELKAMEALEEQAKQDLFVKGMSEELKGTVQATKRAVMNPIKTIKSVPMGMEKFMNDIQSRQAVGRVYGEQGSAFVLDAKRKLAYELKVDPYSDNEQLQTLMGNVAKNKNRGALVASIGTLIVPGGVGLAVTAVDMNDDFLQTLRDKSAPELFLDAQNLLIAMGCYSESAAGIFNGESYTATNITVIAHALGDLRDVVSACRAMEVFPMQTNAEGAMYVQTGIKMAAAYHKKIQPFKELKLIADTPVFLNKANRQFIFMPVDYLYWNEVLDKKIQAYNRMNGPGSTEIWISGTATPGAREALKRQGILLVENAENKLGMQSANKK